MEKLKSKSFNKGLREVPYGKYKDIKCELMEAIGTNSDVTWLKYKNGNKKYLDINLAANIESIFYKYGILNPWGK